MINLLNRAALKAETHKRRKSDHNCPLFRNIAVRIKQKLLKLNRSGTNNF